MADCNVTSSSIVRNTFDTVRISKLSFIIFSFILLILSSCLDDEEMNNDDEFTIYRIPVVVHVVHNGEPIGTGTNISEAQV